MYSDLRKNIINKRKKLSKVEIEQKSDLISEKIFETNLYDCAETIFIYINFGFEVSTHKIIKKCWKDNKKVVVPVTVGNRNMYFGEITDFSNLTTKKIGTLEPDIKQSDEILPNKKSLFIVPGLAFDMFCNRLGYGGGYYDTYIEKYNVENTIGVCYDFQIFEKLCTKPHDKKMKCVITEKRTIIGDKNE